MSLPAAALLGAVQAATEFLPVSSTAHLLVFGELMGQSLDDPRFRAFVTIIQSGTTLAVIAFFRAELWQVAAAGLKSLGRRSLMETRDSRLAWFIAVGTLPAAAAGALLERSIESLGNWVIAGSLVAWALALLLAERLARQERTVADIRAGDALIVGVGQAAALVPGTSRSGATIAAGMLLGLRREDAARFSFMLSVPIILGAGAYKVGRALPALRDQPEWRSATLAATAVALLFGYLVIGWLLRWLRTRTTHLFVAWRLVAAAVIAVLIWRGVLPGDGARPGGPAELRSP